MPKTMSTPSQALTGSVAVAGDAATEDKEAARLRAEIEHLQLLLIERERLASVGLLISDIAHEIYNPLAWVKLNEAMWKMSVEAYLESGDKEAFLKRVPKFAELLQSNQDGLDRIQNVVDALRLMSRRHSDARADEDLNGLCQRTLVMLAHVFKQKSVTVDTEWAELRPVKCNGNDVAQAVMNLLVNANDAVATAGRISVRTGTADGHAFIEIEDNGPGIPPQARDRIFEPFFTTKPLGTGLGLPLVRSVAQDHGGSIEVGSSRWNGARFRLSIPIEP